MFRLVYISQHDLQIEGNDYIKASSICSIETRLNTFLTIIMTFNTLHFLNSYFHFTISRKYHNISQSLEDFIDISRSLNEKHQSTEFWAGFIFPDQDV